MERGRVQSLRRPFVTDELQRFQTALEAVPKILLGATDPVGPENERWLRYLGEHVSVVVAAWGAAPIAKCQAVRVAALLELCERADDGRALFTEPISVTAMDSAVRIMRALTTHALAVFWEMSADSEQALLAYVLKKVRGLPKGSTLRDLHIAVRGKKSIDTIKDVRDLLDDLAERGCLRLRLRPPTGGQPPSPILEINPAILDRHTQKSQKSPHGPSTETSATSARVNPGTGTEKDPAPNPEELSEDGGEYLEDERAGLRTEEPIEDAPVTNGKGTPDSGAQTPSPELWEGPQEPDDTADRAEGVL
ncbi:MAG: DUF1643 domain-containing protein [Gemmatimonadetes bacterium]|nr:DUF1643 domain-containing protein [Gemmatimonadota bacterium]